MGLLFSSVAPAGSWQTIPSRGHLQVTQPTLYFVNIPWAYSLRYASPSTRAAGCSHVDSTLFSSQRGLIRLVIDRIHCGYAACAISCPSQKAGEPVCPFSSIIAVVGSHSIMLLTLVAFKPLKFCRIVVVPYWPDRKASIFSALFGPWLRYSNTLVQISGVTARS